jgi:hypothetical protein
MIEEQVCPCSNSCEKFNVSNLGPLFSKNLYQIHIDFFHERKLWHIYNQRIIRFQEPTLKIPECSVYIKHSTYHVV